jgi:FACT complex subunit SSRP1/POB3
VKPFVSGHWKLQLDEVVPSTKGWNWGDIEVSGPNLAFDVGGEVAFELPLTDVRQCSVTRQDVAIEFHRPAGARSASESDGLVELRFHVPEINQTFAPSDGEEEASPAQLLRKIVLQHADVDEQVGNGLVSLPRMPFLVPRGRSDIELFANHMKVHAKSPWKIPYSSVSRLSKLPKDERSLFFVISLSPPVRQGHATYSHLVLHFQADDHVELELNMSE